MTSRPVITPGTLVWVTDDKGARFPGTVASGTIWPGRYRVQLGPALVLDITGDRLTARQAADVEPGS